jgi:D-alanine transaminase
MKNLAYYNGKIGELEEMTVPMGDRVCFFGDGVYDATYSRNYKIFSLDEHIDRFYRSAALLRIKIGMSKEELKSLLYELVNKMDDGENFVYFQATRGTGERNHLFPDEQNANIWVNIFHKNIVDVYKRVKLITLEDTRFFHCNIKTLNLIPSVIASQTAKEEGCDEAVLHRDGRITECAHSNVHILKDGKLITAPTDNLILAGIARAHIIRACHALGIEVEERPYTLCELRNSDEIIISSAGSLCLGADMLDGKAVGGKAPELLRSLQDYLLAEFIHETEK